MEPIRISWLDRALIAIAPEWGLRRVRARATAQLAARHFEAAAVGRRTSGWSRQMTDANAAASGATLGYLRTQARDLVRNNPWARRGLRRILTSTVGWGIRPKASGRNAERVAEIWKRWGETMECDAAGRLTFYGLQRLVMRTVVESGEALVRRRWRRPEDGLAVPLQLQVLEPDYLDTSKDGMTGVAGGPIVQGIEFDRVGRRVAYWLFDQHPGSTQMQMGNVISRRIPADSILHIYDQERPGQVRGPSWFASVDLRLHDFDEFEDATLLKQKIAACMAAFVTDTAGDNAPLGGGGTDAATGQPLDAFEPGMILNLPPGKQVTVANPPTASDFSAYSATQLRGVAAGLGVTYEDLTGDYSHVTFSSARMGRVAHMADVHDWRWNMLIPQFCVPAWQWMLDAMILSGEAVDATPAEWTPPPVPMLDPGTETEAAMKAVRTGQMTLDEMVREQGFDPDTHWKEYAAGMQRLDKLGIVLDSDPRKTTAAGQAQSVTTPPPAAKPAAAVKPSAAPVGEETDPPPAPEPDDDAADKDAPVKKTPAKSEEVKVFAYHQPYMKAKEIREGIGLPGDVEDGELFGLEFLEKHGGATSGDGGSEPGA
jgi:lambda family phage portal protein